MQDLENSARSRAKKKIKNNTYFIRIIFANPAKPRLLRLQTNVLFFFLSVPEIREKKRKEKKDVEVIAGKDVKLGCQVKDKDVSTYWLKNNQTLHPSDHQRMRLKTNKYLKIKRAEKADAGLYTCVAVNDCGKNTYTRELHVESK